MKSLEFQFLLLLSVQIVFTGSLLLVRKRLKPAIFLFLLIESLFVQTLMKVVNKTWLMETFQEYYYLGYDIPFLFGPLLLLFVLAKLSIHRQGTTWLLLPFFAGATLSWFRLPILDLLGRSAYFWLFACIGLSQLLLIWACARSSLRMINDALAAQGGAISASLLWCRRMVFATAAMGGFLILYLRIAYIFSPFLYLPAIYLPFFLALIALSVFALHEPDERAKGSENGKSKYAHTTMPDEEIAQLTLRLNDLMAHDKLYLDPDLSIARLAELLDTSRHKLSQLLNRGLGKSYPDYINEWRVEEAKRLLVEPQMHQYTLQAVAEAAGFSSYTTFFQVFKKLVGLTPYDYKTNNQKASHQPPNLNGNQRHTQPNSYEQ